MVLGGCCCVLLGILTGNSPPPQAPRWLATVTNGRR